MVFATQFPIHGVGSGLDILVLALSEAPAYRELSAWQDGEMLRKMYTTPR